MACCASEQVKKLEQAEAEKRDAAQTAVSDTHTAGIFCLSIIVNIRDMNTRCYFNVHSKADMSQLNLPHGKQN